MKFSRTGRGYSVDGQQIFEHTRKHGAIGLLVSVLATECQLRLTKYGTESVAQKFVNYQTRSLN